MVTVASTLETLTEKVQGHIPVETNYQNNFSPVEPLGEILVFLPLLRHHYNNVCMPPNKDHCNTANESCCQHYKSSSATKSLRYVNTLMSLDS